MVAFFLVSECGCFFGKAIWPSILISLNWRMLCCSEKVSSFPCFLSHPLVLAYICDVKERVND